MHINVNYIPSEYVPIWYTDTRFKIISIWEWQTPQEMSDSFFRQTIKVDQGFDNSDEERQLQDEAHEEFERSHEPDGEDL